MLLIEYLSLGLVTVTLGAQLWLRSFLAKHAKWFFIGSVFLIISLLSFESISHYKGIIQSEPPILYLAPPFASASSYLLRLWSGLWSHYVFSFIAALIAISLIWLVPAEKRWTWFEKEEPYLIATAIFLTAHPFWIVYLIATLVIFVLYNIAATIIKRRSVRVSFYNFWIPCAVFVILLSSWLQSIGVFQNYVLFQL